MIDYLLTLADQNTAIADPVVGAYYNDGWRGDIVFQPIQIWQPANDVTGTDGDGNPITTHTYLVGFSLIISSNARVPALDTHPATQLVTDRNKALAGKPFVIQSIFTDAQLATYMLQPVPMGSNYPFGAPAATYQT